MFHTKNCVLTHHHYTTSAQSFFFFFPSARRMNESQPAPTPILYRYDFNLSHRVHVSYVSAGCAWFWVLGLSSLSFRAHHTAEEQANSSKCRSTPAPYRQRREMGHESVDYSSIAAGLWRRCTAVQEHPGCTHNVYGLHLHDMFMLGSLNVGY